MRGFLLCALGFLFPLAAFGRPSYRDRIPNGNTVPCSAGLPGCVEGVSVSCSAVGHNSCKGPDYSSGEIWNQFGEDFRKAGFKWTKELCKKDSDGDGFSNGIELGDPCCQWAEGSSPRFAAKAHPGFSAAVPASVEADVSCGAPTPRPTLGSFFKPDEPQKTVTYMIPNFTLPTKRTIYEDFGRSTTQNAEMETATSSD